MDDPYSKEYNEILDYDLNGNISTLKRTAGPINGTAQVIDDLTYGYDDGNRLNTVTDTSQNYGGYPSSSGTLIDYDDNGNMTSQKDKGINSIGYNYLNLPSSVIYSTTYIIQDPFLGNIERNINTKYIYDAGGEKLRSEYTSYAARSQSEVKRITDYLDGFQYENNILQFYPNEEGYFDFVKNRYIYNYKDHLGNIRLSYTKQTDGTARILEETNYYPFGLRHTGYNSVTNIGGTYRYKYNGKEVQENGMYDYGARMYMPEIARWGVMDPMAEQYRAWSPYNYAVNNPVSFIDPDGRMTYDWQLGAYRDNNGGLMGWSMNNVGDSSFGRNTNDSYSGRSSGSDVVSFISNALGAGGGSGAGDPTPKNSTGPGIIEKIGNFFSNLFGGKKSTATGHAVKATIISMTLIPEGVAEGSIFSSLQGVGTGLFSTAGLTAGAIFVPTMIGEPEFNWTRQFDVPTDIPITTTGEPNSTITLYRGVSSKAKNSMYFEAAQGIAIPNGFRQVAATWGPHSDMELHSGGDNLSIWTSWSMNKETARDFATGVAIYQNGIPGIIMSKTFNLGQAVPNPYNPSEGEWLVPGVVYGAKVEYVLPRSK